MVWAIDDEDGGLGTQILIEFAEMQAPETLRAMYFEEHAVGLRSQHFFETRKKPSGATRWASTLKAEAKDPVKALLRKEGNKASAKARWHSDPSVRERAAARKRELRARKAANRPPKVRSERAARDHQAYLKRRAKAAV